jgi:hypothetical protein
MTDALAGLTCGGFVDGLGDGFAEGETDGATGDTADGWATGWVDGDEGKSAPMTAMARITANPVAAAVRRADEVSTPFWYVQLRNRRTRRLTTVTTKVAKRLGTATQPAMN